MDDVEKDAEQPERILAFRRARTVFGVVTVIAAGVHLWDQLLAVARWFLWSVDLAFLSCLLCCLALWKWSGHTFRSMYKPFSRRSRKCP